MRRSLLLSLVFFAACVDRGPRPTPRQIDPAYVEKNLLTEAPSRMSSTVNANLGGKVVYLGNEADKDALAPGEKVTIVHYWEVLEPPGERWRVFAHLVGPSRGDWLNIDDSDMRAGYPPGAWRAGDIIRDEQTVTLPDTWASSHAQLVIGLFPTDGQTSADRMPVVSGPADSESRVPATRFRVEKTARATPASGHVIPRARGPITIDGRASEDDWKSAPASPPFTVAEGSPAMQGSTRARMLWDDDHLYVFVESVDSDVYSPYHDHDDPLWKEDVVEIFIDADRNRRGYVELQVNPNNAQFDAWFATTRAGQADIEWNAGMTSAVVVHGTADHRDDTDTGWDVEIAIPWAAVKGRDETMAVSLPPRVGDTWRLNVVRIDKPRDRPLAAASWNPITYQDFHALGRMLNVRFGDEQGRTQRTRPGARTTERPGAAAHPGAGAAQPGAAQPGAAQPESPAAQPK